MIASTYLFSTLVNVDCFWNLVLDEEGEEEPEKATLSFEISTDVAYAGSKATG